jgi:hypothetical protein
MNLLYLGHFFAFNFGSLVEMYKENEGWEMSWKLTSL